MMISLHVSSIKSWATEKYRPGLILFHNTVFDKCWFLTSICWITEQNKKHKNKVKRRNSVKEKRVRDVNK